jgi:hypothetical protein
MAVGLTNALKNTQANAVISAIDAGSTGGLIKIYSGTRPATADTALSGNTLLATLTFSTTSGTATNGVITFSAITADSSADATGTASFARITDSDGTTVMDLDIGTSGSDINLSSVSINSGDSVSISSFTYTVQ